MTEVRTAHRALSGRQGRTLAAPLSALLLAACTEYETPASADGPSIVRTCPPPPSQDYRAPADYFRTLPQPPLTPDLVHAPSAEPTRVRTRDVTVPADGTVAFISPWACDGSSERADPNAACVALEVWFRTPEGHRLELFTGVAESRVCVGEAVQRGQIVGVAAGAPGQETWAVASRVFGPELAP